MPIRKTKGLKRDTTMCITGHTITSTNSPQWRSEESDTRAPLRRCITRFGGKVIANRDENVVEEEINRSQHHDASEESQKGVEHVAERSELRRRGTWC